MNGHPYKIIEQAVSPKSFSNHFLYDWGLIGSKKRLAGKIQGNPLLTNLNLVPKI